jgi:ElaB/YqjD/DUF883 family membrane-anchored ribosome-binding protein
MATATRNLEKDIAALRQDVTALAESISQMAAGTDKAKAAVRNGIDEGINGAASAGRDFLAHAAHLTSHSAEVTEEAASNAASFVAGEIKRNPLMAVAAAAAVGFLAGMAQHR